MVSQVPRRFATSGGGRRADRAAIDDLAEEILVHRTQRPTPAVATSTRTTPAERTTADGATPRRTAPTGTSSEVPAFGGGTIGLASVVELGQPASGPVDDAAFRASDLAVVAGRELSAEQLVDHARTLGRDPQLSDLSDEELERRFVSHTAALNAATARWFVLLAEVVIRGVWADQGARTPAQWLSWRVGLALSTAREQLRVALRLRELPVVMERFASGSLSYSKVRAITRIAVPEMQELLLTWADHATGADLERVSRGVARARRAASVNPDLQPPSRGAALRFTDDGVTILLHYPLEDGLAVYSGLERLADAEEALEEADLAADETLPHRSRSERIADVAAAVVLAARDQAPPDTSGLDRHTLVLEADADDLAREEATVPVRVPGRRVPAMSARVLRRLACDAGVVLVVSRDGSPLDVGRRHREPNAQQRRALRARDRCCRFPGCGATRHLHAHHVEHWADGGPTDMDNLVLLCSAHHRLVHEPGWRLEHLGGGRFRFLAPGVGTMAAVPALGGAEPDPARVDPVDVAALTPVSSSFDDPLDVDLLISVIDQELRISAPHLVTSAA
jgi:hypothetical protein